MEEKIYVCIYIYHIKIRLILHNYVTDLLRYNNILKQDIKKDNDPSVLNQMDD